MTQSRKTKAHRFRVILLAIAISSIRCNKDSGTNTSNPSHESRTLAVAAAASMKPALDELVSEFAAANPSMHVKVTYGSSGSLLAQITNHAPFDFFLSADAEYPQRLIADDVAIRNSRFQYAVGSLVVWTRIESNLDPTKSGIQTLIEPPVRKIAIANPKLAPYGRAAEAAMKKLGVHDAAKDKLVLGENIAQAAQFVESGTADIGIIARSLAASPPLRDRGRYWPIPTDAHEPIVHEGVILRRASDQAAANQFRNFILSTRGREIFAKHGFEPPGD